MGIEWERDQKRDQDRKNLVYLQGLPNLSATTREWYSSDSPPSQKDWTWDRRVREVDKCLWVESLDGLT